MCRRALTPFTHVNTITWLPRFSFFFYPFFYFFFYCCLLQYTLIIFLLDRRIHFELLSARYRRVKSVFIKCMQHFTCPWKFACIHLFVTKTKTCCLIDQFCCFCLQTFSNNNLSDILTPPYSEDANGYGFPDDLDSFSEISLTQSSACNTPEPASLPSFQETYANLGFKMEEDHFSFGNQTQFPHVSQQTVQLSAQYPSNASCGVQYDFGQLFSPVSNSCFQSGQPLYGHEVQLHAPMHPSHPYPTQPPQTVFEVQPPTTSQIDQLPYNLAAYTDVNVMVTDIPMSPNVGLKQRRNSTASQRDHPILR